MFKDVSAYLSILLYLIWAPYLTSPVHYSIALPPLWRICATSGAEATQQAIRDYAVLIGEAKRIFWLGDCSPAHSCHSTYISVEKSELLWGAGSDERSLSSQHSKYAEHSHGEAWYCRRHLESCIEMKINRIDHLSPTMFYFLVNAFFIFIDWKHYVLKSFVFDLI